MDTFSSFTALFEANSTQNMATGNMSPEHDTYKGLQYTLHTDEGTEPPHVHVYSQDSKSEAKFWIVPEVAVAKRGRVKDHELSQAKKYIKKNYASLKGKYEKIEKERQ